MVKLEPTAVLKNLQTAAKKVSKNMPEVSSPTGKSLGAQGRLPGFSEMELNDVEFHWHPVVTEKFDIKRLKKTIETAHFFARPTTGPWPRLSAASLPAGPAPKKLMPPSAVWKPSPIRFKFT